MVKIITALEARIIEGVLEENIEVLRQEGYDDEASATYEALTIIRALVEKSVEEVIK